MNRQAIAALVLVVWCQSSAAVSLNVSSFEWYQRMTNYEDDGALGQVRTDPDSGCEIWQSADGERTDIYGRVCATFPRRAAVLSSHVVLRDTNITTIADGDLDSIEHVVSLVIEANFELETIEPDVFRNLSRLERLTIRENYKLIDLHESSFQGLENLTDLTLSNVYVGNLYDIVYSLPYDTLTSLQLSENNLDYIDDSLFAQSNDTKIKVLRLNKCNLHYVDPNAFKILTNLEVLDLEENNLGTNVVTDLVKSLVKENKKLNSLNLGALVLNGKTGDLFSALADSNVTYLNMGRNSLESFPLLPSVEVLNISYVMFSRVKVDGGNFATMQRLKQLILSHDNLTELFEFVLLPQLELLDLSANSDCRTRNSVFQIKPNSFANMTNLKVLNLARNSLVYVTSNTFNGLASLQALFLTRSCVYNINDYSFRRLVSLKVLDMSYNDISKALTTNTFDGLSNLELLNLEGCSLEAMDSAVFYKLRNLQYLILRSNKIIVIDPDTIKALPKLNVLDLSANNIIPWNFKVFKNNSHLRKVYLRNNGIPYFTKGMINDFHDDDIFVDFTGNPFFCNCKVLDFFSNAENTAARVRYNDYFLNKTKIHCAYPSEWKNVLLRDFINISDSTICNANAGLSFPWIPALIGVVVISVLLALGYHYRWYFNHCMFLYRIKVKRRGKRSHVKGHSNYMYDAFVCFSDEDKNFVVRLVAMLENFEPFFKLYVYERDFQLDSVVDNSVLEHTAMSRKIVMVISDSFVKSQWQMWENHITKFHQVLVSGGGGGGGGKGNASLIMIKLGDVRSSHITPTLKYLMKTSTFIPWNHDPVKQREFWNTLRTSLETPNKIEE